MGEQAVRTRHRDGLAAVRQEFLAALARLKALTSQATQEAALKERFMTALRLNAYYVTTMTRLLGASTPSTASLPGQDSIAGSQVGHPAEPGVQGTAVMAGSSPPRPRP
jgi:hypothetical protein